jgi:CheY-like chemotaxis protein
MPDASIPFHILVVDRSQDVRTLFQDMLSYEGYRVTTLYALPDVLGEIDTLEPDLVILDSMWSQHDVPWSQLQRLRMHRPTTPIPLILCSGDGTSSPEMDERLRSLGVQVINKPFDLDDLYQAIHALFNDLHSPA